ncbi:MAG: PleD family two-component system response regulator [Sandaracinaceae bacterium]
MAVKILAVDDSATMRRVLEMTFAGEGVQIKCVSNGQTAIEAAAANSVDLVIADASMDTSGYDVAAALKGNPATANIAVIVLASQHNPYDSAKGKDAGVDDHILKPYDTQAMIDKAKDVLSKPRAKASGAAARPVAPASPPSPPTARGAGRPLVPAAQNNPRATVAFGAVTPARPERTDDAAAAGARAPVGAPKPLSLSRSPAASTPNPAPASVSPTPAPARSAPSAPTSSAAAAATSSNGAMAAKLGELGLTREQVDGVLALSRDVIERVVWEVVPELAETMIREEIRRLTAD